LTGERLHLSGGWAVMQMLDGLARGLDAFIPSGLLSMQVRIFKAWRQGNQAEARRLFEKILPIMAFSNQHIDVSGRFWKRVRVQQGIFTTANCRLPKPLDPVQTAEAEHMCERVLTMESA
jgi:4-hydroxy-tetrahydrodipicolinate synthase